MSIVPVQMAGSILLDSGWQSTWAPVIAASLSGIFTVVLTWLIINKSTKEMKAVITQNKEIEERKMSVASHYDWMHSLITEFSMFCAKCESISDDVFRAESCKKMVSEGRTEWVRKEFLRKMESKQNEVNEDLNSLYLNLFKFECLLDTKNVLHKNLLDELFNQHEKLDSFFQSVVDGKVPDGRRIVSKELVNSMRAVREDANKRMNIE